MAFSGRRFTAVKRNCATYDEKSYAILQTFEKMDYWFWGTQPLHMFTDQKTLL